MCKRNKGEGKKVCQTGDLVPFDTGGYIQDFHSIEREDYSYFAYITSSVDRRRQQKFGKCEYKTHLFILRPGSTEPQNISFFIEQLEQSIFPLSLEFGTIDEKLFLFVIFAEIVSSENHTIKSRRYNLLDNAPIPFGSTDFAYLLKRRFGYIKHHRRGGLLYHEIKKEDPNNVVTLVENTNLRYIIPIDALIVETPPYVLFVGAGAYMLKDAEEFGLQSIKINSDSAVVMRVNNQPYLIYRLPTPSLHGRTAISKLMCDAILPGEDTFGREPLGELSTGTSIRDMCCMKVANKDDRLATATIIDSCRSELKVWKLTPTGPSCTVEMIHCNVFPFKIDAIFSIPHMGSSYLLIQTGSSNYFYFLSKQEVAHQLLVAHDQLIKERESKFAYIQDRDRSKQKSLMSLKTRPKICVKKFPKKWGKPIAAAVDLKFQRALVSFKIGQYYQVMKFELNTSNPSESFKFEGEPVLLSFDIKDESKFFILEKLHDTYEKISFCNKSTKLPVPLALSKDVTTAMCSTPVGRLALITVHNYPWKRRGKMPTLDIWDTNRMKRISSTPVSDVYPTDMMVLNPSNHNKLIIAHLHKIYLYDIYSKTLTLIEETPFKNGDRIDRIAFMPPNSRPGAAPPASAGAESAQSNDVICVDTKGVITLCSLVRTRLIPYERLLADYSQNFYAIDFDSMASKIYFVDDDSICYISLSSTLELGYTPINIPKGFFSSF